MTTQADSLPPAQQRPAMDMEPDPSGGVGSMGNGLQVSDILPFGQASQFLGQEKSNLNPMMSAPAQAIIKNARDRINDHLRSIGEPVYDPKQDIPGLLILIEIRKFTKEPLKTDATRALSELQVELCTSRRVKTVWKRATYEAVPFQVRQFPLHVANMFLQQIENFVIYPFLDQAKGMFVGRKMAPGQMVRVSWNTFRDPTPEEKNEISRKNRMPSSAAHLTRLRDNQGGAELMLDLNPRAGDNSGVVDASKSVPTSEGKSFPAIGAGARTSMALPKPNAEAGLPPAGPNPMTQQPPVQKPGAGAAHVVSVQNQPGTQAPVTADQPIGGSTSRETAKPAAEVGPVPGLPPQPGQPPAEGTPAVR